MRHTRAGSSLSLLPLSLIHPFSAPSHPAHLFFYCPSHCIVLLLSFCSVVFICPSPSPHALFFPSVCTLSLYSPVSTNLSSVCTSPGSRFRLQATVSCLLYFKTPDGPTTPIKFLNKSLQWFCPLHSQNPNWFSLVVGRRFPLFSIFSPFLL